MGTNLMKKTKKKKMIKQMEKDEYQLFVKICLGVDIVSSGYVKDGCT